jgi:hypothetical protein
MSDDRPIIEMPPLCKSHRSLLVHGAGYKQTDPWMALEVATQAVLFQGATCEKIIWEKLGGDVTKLPTLGCLACLCPDKFTLVVEAAKTKDIGAVAALGKQWIEKAQT